jgi:hypothetical protein
MSLRSPWERWAGFGVGGGSILGPILVGHGFRVAEVAPAALAATFLTSIAGVVSGVYEIPDGMAASVRDYETRAEALEAAGLRVVGGPRHLGLLQPSTSGWTVAL